MMKQKSKYIVAGIIAVLVIIGIILASVFLFPECKINDDCLAKTCFTAQCTNNKCGYSPVTDCCGNDMCETDETYNNCAADCPNCDDDNECTKDSYDHHEQKCINEPLAPCYLRPITLAPATSEIDYQIKIDLTPSNFGYSKTKTNGEDIRFFDENDNPLNYWIEDWNGAGGISTIWVKVSGSGTDKIYMSYGHPDASSASTASAVFEFFEDFDYSDESELTQVWDKYGSPVIELSDGIVTITASKAGEHGGQHIFKNVGASILLNNIVEIRAKRFPGHHSHMANIGYTLSTGGSISDGNCWAALRYSPSPDGTHVVFGGNNGGINSSPIDSFNTIKIYHQDGVSYAYEPPDIKVAEYSWPKEPPPGGYVLLGGATTISGSGKASYDWIRVRKYASIEPSATVGNEEAANR